MTKKKAIDIIEPAHSYYLLSNDKKSKPVFVGGRIKLEFALQDVKSDMIIATMGKDKRCVILIDHTTDEVVLLAQKANNSVLKLKGKN